MLLGRLQDSRLRGNVRSCSKVQNAAGFLGGSGMGKVNITVVMLSVTVLTRGKYLQTL